MTQNQQIANYLNNGKAITPIQALNKFNCFRLAARISDLRKDGMKIITKIVTKQGKSYASYSII
jgi:rare lipoprotein A